MPGQPLFIRNRTISVRQVDERALIAVCRLDDNRFSARVGVTFKLPDLEIVRIEAEIGLDRRPVGPALDGAVGLRVGPGLNKMLAGLVGPAPHRETLVAMIEECCQGVILAFTKQTLDAAPPGQAEDPAGYRSMVRANPRLLNRCAAFAPGSSLVDDPAPTS